MTSTTYAPTQQRWTSTAPMPTGAPTSASLPEVGVDLRVRGTRASFAGIRGIRGIRGAAAVKATVPGTSAWRPPTS